MKASNNKLLFQGLIFVMILLTLFGCRRNPSNSAQPEWTRTLNDSTKGAINDIIFGDGVFVAVGHDGQSYPGPKFAAFWTSIDGFLWTHSSIDRQIFPIGSEITSIYHFDGLIATGTIHHGEPAIWKAKADGSEWRLFEREFRDQKGLLIQDKNRIIIKDIMTIPEGPITGGRRIEIIAGAILSDERDDVVQAAIWQLDYITNIWREVYREPLSEVSDKFGGSIINSVIETSRYIIDQHGPAYIAVGSYDNFRGTPLKADQDPAIWVSSDSENWTRQPIDSTVFASDQNLGLENDQRLYTAMIQGKAIYVGGYEENHTSSDGSLIWTSLDNGVTWERLTDINNGQNMPAFDSKHIINGLSSTNLPFGYGEVAVGTVVVDGYEYAAFWRGATGNPRWSGGAEVISEKGALKQVLSDGKAIVVVGHVRLEPAIWTFGIPED